MNIQLNTSSQARIDALQASVSAANAQATATVETIPALLSTNSVKISEARGDLERLAALLTAETDEARENSVLDIFINAYETVRAVNEDAADGDQQLLMALGVAAENSAEISAVIEEATEGLAATETLLDLFGTARQDYQDELDVLMQNELVDTDPELIAKKAELEAAITSLNNSLKEVETAAAGYQASYDAAVAEMEQVTQEIDANIEKLSDESYRALIEAAMVKLADYVDLSEPLAEEEAETKPKPISDMSISELIQYAREVEARMIDNIESKREQMI